MALINCDTLTGEYPKGPDGWPLHWPVLTAGDICKRDYSRNEQRCATGWLYTVATGKPSHESGAWDQVWFQVVMDRLNDQADGYVPHWNDRTPANVVAAALNQFGRDMGYDVPARMCKPENCR